MYPLIYMYMTNAGNMTENKTVSPSLGSYILVKETVNIGIDMKCNG